MTRLFRPNPPAAATAANLEPGRWLPWAVFALLFVAVLVAYFPALKGDFLWDDAGHVTNPSLQSLSGLLRIWFEPGATQQYYPLLHSAFWLEHKLWGDAVLGYHLANVLQHALAACLLITVLRRLAIPGALFAGLLFALHPVCVESVAWISEQKNTLSAIFYLLALRAWLQFEDHRRPAAYAIATLWFCAALLTKTVTATLPAALLVIAWWQRGRVSWRTDVLPLLPWFALSVAGGLFTAHFERELIGAQGADFSLGALDRVVLAGRVVWFYFAKLLWPLDLIFVYPRWNIDASEWWQWLYPVAAISLLAGLAWWSRRSRGPLAVALLFGGTLFPVLGFFNVYPFVFSYVADHFQYLASLAVFALAGAGLNRVPGRTGTVILAVVAGLLAVLTRDRAGFYRDNETLYGHTLRANPRAWLASHNLATLLADRGQHDLAVPYINDTLALRPDFPEALNNLGNSLTQLGRAGEAIAPLERAIQLQPKYAEAQNNLGAALMALGRPDEGRARFEAAVKLKPDYALAHRNLGQAFLSARQLPEATPHFQRAVKLNPADLQARLQLGTALAMQSRYAEALPEFQAALELDPESADAHLRLAMTLRSLGRIAESNSHYQEAVRLNPALGR